MSHAPTHYSVVAADPTNLSTFAGVNTGDEALVTSLGYSFTYDAASTATVDNLNVINGPAGAGRWIKSATPGGIITYAPGLPDSASSCSTWAGVMEAIAKSSSPMTVLVSMKGMLDTHVDVPTGVWDMKDARMLFADDEGGGNSNEVRFAVGTQLLNLAEFSGYMTIVSKETTPNFPGLKWTYVAPYNFLRTFTMDRGSQITTVGTTPVIILDNTIVVNIRVLGESTLFARNGVNTTHLIHCLAGATVLIQLLGLGGYTTAGFAPYLIDSADGTATLILITAALSPIDPRAAFTDFLGAINWSTIGGTSAPSARRPQTANVGFNMFDSTLGKPIWLKSTGPNVWVDATGAAV